MSKRIGVVFPGYGEQFVGMGKDIYDEVRTVQEFFEQAAGTADINFVKLLFASSDEEISSIRHAYLAIYLFEVSLYQVLYEKGLRPDFVAGYGIGEYAAAYASRSLNFFDALYILNKYAQFYDEFMQDKDFTVLRIFREFDVQSLQELCDRKSTKNQPAYISSQNTDQAFYVAGTEKTIAKIQKYCIEEVIRKVKVIGAGYGLHSPLMDEVVERLKPYYHKIQFKPLAVPLITNVDGVYITGPDALESALMRKINNRVQWFDVMKGFEGCDVIVSVGPGSQLIEWFKEVYPEKQYHIVSSLKDFDAIASLLTPGQVQVVESAHEAVETKKDLLEADIINERASDYDIEDED
ncbi:MAG TPA: ACP S-malonyltransferase [Candidatus Saccharimonadales bacterium]|nr:ACP S-malonyltransferase [Candidatus Saccharimonadales bacterium]